MQTPAQSNVPPGVPHLVKFSSLLKDASGNLLTNTVGVTFAIYDEQVGGAPLWQETQNVQFSQGRYVVFLGASTSEGVPPELFSSGQPRWLGVTALLPGEEEQPRVQLSSVPYALKAVDADTLGGLPASAFVRVEAGGSSNIVGGTTTQASSAGYTQPSSSAVKPPTLTTVTTPGGTANTVALFTGASTIANSVISQSGSNVGINTTTPAQSLDIFGGILHVAGVTNPATAAQGSYLGWNALTGATGETDFINNEGTGPGGFAFMNTPLTGSPRTTLMTLSGSGNLTGEVNGVVNPMICGSTNPPAWCTTNGSGSDIGFWVNQAIKYALPNGCGTVQIPSGTYSQMTTIFKPRCVKLVGQSALGTALTWYGASGGYAVVAADSSTNYAFPEGGIEDLMIQGPAPGTTAVGIFVGGDPGCTGTCTTDPSSNIGAHQNFNRIRVANFTTGIEFGNNTWSITISESTLYVNVDAILVAAGASNSGEQMVIENSSINQNSSYAIYTSAPSFCPYYCFLLIHDSFDFNGNGTVAPIQTGFTSFGSYFIANTGPFFDTGGSPIVDFGSTWFMGSGSYFGQLGGTENLFSGSMFNATSANTDLFNGTGSASTNLVGIILAANAVSLRGNNSFYNSLSITSESSHATHAACYKAGGQLGYCSTSVSSSGTCTCN